MSAWKNILPDSSNNLNTSEECVGQVESVEKKQESLVNKDQLVENISAEELSWNFDMLNCDSDEIIAHMLQLQYDAEYNEKLKQLEQSKNKQSKVTVSFENYRRGNDFDDLEPIYNDDDDEYEEVPHYIDGKRVKNNKLTASYSEDGAYMPRSFPPHFDTGVEDVLDIKLSHKVMNQLRYARPSTSNSGSNKKNKKQDRKDDKSTAEMGVDGPTRLLLYKLVNNNVLEQINGVISTGKEALILHANTANGYHKLLANKSNESNTSIFSLPEECAIKIFKTTLNNFKQRDRYIKDDYRFKDRFAKPNRNHIVIDMWAEKEMLNIIRMQNVGIKCPQAVILKKHILVMSFIGKNNVPAEKLKNANLNIDELKSAYDEIVIAMHKLYNEAKLVHADLSEYNILWHDGVCWFIDVAQSVDTEHPAALEFLMRDCANIINFFTKSGLQKIFTKEQLFEHICSIKAENVTAMKIERIYDRSASNEHGKRNNQKREDYPFELAWEMSQKEQKTLASVNEAAT